MNNGSYGIEGNALNFFPSILDASVFTSFPHCDVLLRAGEKFFVSATLYTMLYEKYDRETIYNTLRYFVGHPLEDLPWEKLELQPYLKPYRFKEKYVEEIYPYYKKSLLPSEVKDIILDEYSFLKEHSSILMATKRFARHLHRWGIVLVDATNKRYDRKHRLFKKIRGARWLAAVLLSAAARAAHPLLSPILATIGTVLIVFDP